MKKEIDMINGRLFPQMLRFAIPIILSSVLQTLYNTADSFVVGRYGSTNALAAVGGVSPIVGIFLNMFLGLATGTNIIVAKYCGAGDKNLVKTASDTAIVTAIISGFLIGLLGFVIASPLAIFIQLDSEIIDMAVLYMRIYFLGLPFASLYNFAASTLRGIGNTKGPMICLIVSGLVNVVFNVIFVKYCGMQVEGVAIATVMSEIVAAIMVMYMLKKSSVGFSLKDFTPKMKLFVQTVKIGLPAGIQGMLFSASNTIIISGLNSFGASAVAANTVISQVENIIYVAINSITQTVATFTSQNIGARKPERINPIFTRGLLIALIIGLILSPLFYLFKDPLIEMFAPGDAEVAKYALIKCNYVLLPYFTVALMEIPGGMIRGMGQTLISMIMSVIGVCGVRIMWVLFVFPLHRTLGTLYISYVLSWLATGIAYFIAYSILKKRLFHTISSDASAIAV